MNQRVRVLTIISIVLRIFIFIGMCGFFAGFLVTSFESARELGLLIVLGSVGVCVLSFILYIIVDVMIIKAENQGGDIW